MNLLAGGQLPKHVSSFAYHLCHSFIHSFIIQMVTCMYQAPVKCQVLDFLNITYSFGSDLQHRRNEHCSKRQGKSVLVDLKIYISP